MRWTLAMLIAGVNIASVSVAHAASKASLLDPPADFLAQPEVCDFRGDFKCKTDYCISLIADNQTVCAASVITDPITGKLTYNFSTAFELSGDDYFLAFRSSGDTYATIHPSGGKVVFVEKKYKTVDSNLIGDNPISANSLMSLVGGKMLRLDTAAVAGSGAVSADITSLSTVATVPTMFQKTLKQFTDLEYPACQLVKYISNTAFPVSSDTDSQQCLNDMYDAIVNQGANGRMIDLLSTQYPYRIVLPVVEYGRTYASGNAQISAQAAFNAVASNTVTEIGRKISAYSDDHAVDSLVEIPNWFNSNISPFNLMDGTATDMTLAWLCQYSDSFKSAISSVFNSGMTTSVINGTGDSGQISQLLNIDTYSNATSQCGLSTFKAAAISQLAGVAASEFNEFISGYLSEKSLVNLQAVTTAWGGRISTVWGYSDAMAAYCANDDLFNTLASTLTSSDTLSLIQSVDQFGDFAPFYFTEDDCQFRSKHPELAAFDNAVLSQEIAVAKNVIAAALASYASSGKTLPDLATVLLKTADPVAVGDMVNGSSVLQIWSYRSTVCGSAEIASLASTLNSSEALATIGAATVEDLATVQSILGQAGGLLTCNNYGVDFSPFYTAISDQYSILAAQSEPKGGGKRK